MNWIPDSREQFLRLHKHQSQGSLRVGRRKANGDSRARPRTNEDGPSDAKMIQKIKKDLC
jgi:hypothetical protein